MAYNTVTITDSATKIVTANSARQSIIIENAGTSTVYIGPDDSITTSNAVPLLANSVLSEDNSGGRMWKGDWYGIVASGTVDVRYWEREQNL